MNINVRKVLLKQLIFNNQNGSHLVVVLLGVIVFAVVGFTGYKVLGYKDKVQNPNTTIDSNASSQESEESAAGPVFWQFNEQASAWKPNRTAPDCKEPFVFDQSPGEEAARVKALPPRDQAQAKLLRKERNPVVLPHF